MVVSGKGLDPVGVIVNEPSQFVVDARGAGKAELNVGLRDVDLNPVEVSVKDNKDGTFLCSYVPTRSVRHMALIAYGGLAIPGSPFRVSPTLLSSWFCGRFCSPCGMEVKPSWLALWGFNPVG